MLRVPECHGLAASAAWRAILGRFSTAGLAEIADTAVASRNDTKFVLRAEELRDVLAELDQDYLVLDIDGTRFTRYRTQYFDTESFALFRRHHVGGSKRCKVRTRHYGNTGLSFLEVKCKTKTGATTKVRVPTTRFETETLHDYADFLEAHCPYPVAALSPALRNGFDRITLINAARHERLTIDLDLTIEEQAGNGIDLPRIAVAELKQERLVPGWRESEFLSAMRRIGVRRTGFSKYCIGLLLSRPGIKHNLFKPQLMKLRRLMGETNAVA